MNWINVIKFSGFQHVKKVWTQSDLRFCENEGQTDLKSMKMGGQLDGKSRSKLMQNA